MTEPLFAKEVLLAVRERLLETDETIAVAESVTAGFLQAAFSTVPDAAKFFQGGITAYNLGQKYRHLHVNPIHAEGCNCVSAQVAEKMAIGVCHLFASHWGVGITGYATRVAESDDELHAWFCITHTGKVVVAEKLVAHTPEGPDTQLFYVNHVLEVLAQTVKKELAGAK